MKRMRTTVNLDDDIASAIERLRKEQGLGLSQAVNQLARAGLRPRARRTPFRQRTARIGVTVDVSNVAEVLEQLDGPSAR
jgi:metal-responsive CopG/Arc/MetJ family transcriptional regulator